MLKKVIFLDRDGTICEDQDYLDDWRKMKIFPYAFEALNILKDKGYQIYVVSNQSGVARGKFSIDEAESQREYVLGYFNRERVVINDYLYCPHHKDGIIEEFSIDCDCRKPNMGLAKRAVDIHLIDKERSYMVGDKLIDVEFGKNLGIIPVLVLTGYGNQELIKLKEKIPVFNNIYEFAVSLDS